MQQNERILFNEYGTQLRYGDDDRFILNVLCGRVGQFGVEFQLNEVESAEYRKRGDSFVQELAKNVRENWEPCAARGRTC
jgi:hypothetical protein